MKWISRSLILALVLAAVLCVVPSASADVMVVDPGQTVSFTIEYTGACAVEGEIVFSDSSIISNVQYDISECGMDGLAESGLIFLYSDNADGVDGRIVITITVHSAAPKGSSCVVTLKYAITEPGSDFPGEMQSIANTVTVRTDSAATEPKETEPTDTTPTVKYADTSKLREQIEIAENLTYYDYTKESWAEVEQAVASGKQLLTSTSQTKVDRATKDIKTALENLVPMDYTALQEAMDGASEMGNLDELAEYWERFIQALANARTQRTSGDQAAVNAATEELLASKDALMQALENMGELVVIEKEVPVEVEPSYPYCNKSSHTLILIIMIISLVLNAVLIALILLYLYKKHMHERDNTPLVDYNIDDDIDGMNEDMLE